MEPVPEDTTTDWERLRAAFNDLRKRNYILAIDTAQPDERWEETHDRLAAEVEKSGALGSIHFDDKSKGLAEAGGMLALDYAVNDKRTLGHRIVRWLFNENTVLALRDAERRSFAERICRVLRLHGLHPDLEPSSGGLGVRGKWV